MSSARQTGNKSPGKRPTKQATNHQPDAPRRRNQRRALSHIGGAVSFRGDDPELQSALEGALQVNSDEEQTRAHLHGFHSYPARLHPLTARGIIEALSKPGDVVLDPFCGSGTVLLEAQASGRKPLGSDVNPLSVMLCETKCDPTTDSLREQLRSLAAKVVDFANDRRSERAGPTRKYSPVERQWFDIHVLLELDGLKAGIEEHARGRQRDTLLLALSSIMTKVSRKPGDSARGEVRKRLASGYTIKMFERRIVELCKQQAQYEKKLPKKYYQARVLLADARKLQGVSAGSVDLVVCSPPYPGVFDYLDHHALRFSWLGLDAGDFERAEIGARRQMIKLGEGAYDRWRADFTRVLETLIRVGKPQSSVAMVIADSVVGERAVFADDLGEEVARELGLRVRAICSQRRPYFHQKTLKAFGSRKRKEHLIVFQLPSAAERSNIQRSNAKRS